MEGSGADEPNTLNNNESHRDSGDKASAADQQ
jgi:hypothetical protein